MKAATCNEELWEGGRPWRERQGGGGGEVVFCFVCRTFGVGTFSGMLLSCLSRCVCPCVVEIIVWNVTCLVGM